MDPKTRTFCKLSFFVAVFGVLLISSVMITGQPASRHHVGLPDDWSHHHLIFSNPGTYEQAVANGTYSRWINMRYDTRFILQQIKRNYAAVGVASPEVMTAVETQASANANKPAPPPKQTLKKDWSMDLGSGAKVGAGQYPAKYTFSPIATPSCTNDFVAFNTSLAGVSTYGSYQASILAYNNLYKTTCSSGSVPNVYWQYNTNAGTAVTSPVLSVDGTKLAFVQSVSGVANLVLLKPLTGSGAVGCVVQLLSTSRTITTTNTSGTATLTSTSACFNPADVGATVTGTGIPSNTTISNVTSTTMVTLSKNTTAGVTSAVVTDANTTNGDVSNANFNACTAPCMTTLAFSKSANDTNSSPYYDYAHDTIYVGDNSGYLHKFNPVLLGTLAEVGTPFATVGGTSDVLTSPVYDPASTHIFVADAGGFLYGYNTSGTKVMESSQLTASGSKGVVDAPLVDSTTELVYVFVGDDANTNGGSAGYDCNLTTGCSGVFQFAATNNTIPTAGLTCTATTTPAWPTGANCGNESVLGTGSSTASAYEGSFDNIYYSGSGTTGNLWICTNNSSTEPKLVYQEMSSFPSPIGRTTAINVTNPLTGAAASCSPVTEVYGAGGTTNDYIFLSVTNDGNQTVCSGTGAAGACIYNYLVASGGTQQITGTTTATHGLAAASGASGIVIDNVSSSTGASQIYFSTLGNQSCAGNGATGSGTGGCAVQASQAALQ